MARIRVFDPACGSGNFLVIAYKEMRGIEAEINKRRGEPGRRSDIPLTNFRGIELRHFPAEIARLALIIAEYQADVVYRGQKEALAAFLPLDQENWIVQGNALRLDWLSVCPPTGTGVKHRADDLFETPLDQTQIDFENEGGETYICGNPPYLGSQWQTDEQKDELRGIFDFRTQNWKSLDYVAGWFMKAADYGSHSNSVSAFVSTNSICQGRQVETLWSLIFGTGHDIQFAYTSFRWANLASHNAGVTVVIVGIAAHSNRIKYLYSIAEDGSTVLREATNINAYLAPAANVLVEAQPNPRSGLPNMSFGSMPNDGGYLLLPYSEAKRTVSEHGVQPGLFRPFYGSQEFIRGYERRCIWVNENEYLEAQQNGWLNSQFDKVRAQREASNRPTTKLLAAKPYRFGEVRQVGDETSIIVPSVSSEAREFLPVGFLPSGSIVSNLAFSLYNAPLWNLSLIASKLHMIWVATVCGKLKTDYRYSNTLGWNTFPVPPLTERNKADLTRCAEDILLAREAHFPATIADLYDPETMPADLRAAHEGNDEVLERIYIGRRFRNDTERLEKLFELYTKMVANDAAKPKGKTRKVRADG
nr:DNA methyltransferase [Devosia aurantiaca]